MNLRYLACLALLTGCGEVTLAGLTVPPPGKVAYLDAENNDLQLSRGVAFGFECTANDDYSGPCRDAIATVTDELVASVYPSYLDSLAQVYDGGNAGPRNRTAFVVVALHAGSTKLKVTTSDGDVEVDVSVE